MTARFHGGVECRLVTGRGCAARDLPREPPETHQRSDANALPRSPLPTKVSGLEHGTARLDMTSEATTTSATATTTTTTGTIAGTTLADGVDASSDAPLGAFVGVSSKKASVRRPKRKQGVACDTCRLRRVRCDLTERPEGTGCSRCEDKRINCTDEYIQAKKKGKTGASGTPSGSNSNSSGAATAPGEIISIGNDAHPSVSDQSYRRGSPDDWSSETEIPSISTSLSTSLIQTFFHTTHFALTILDAFTFLARYDSAGHRAEAMDGPVGPVLAAAVEAWGARCSAEQVIFDENVWRTPYGAEGVDARGTLDPASTRASLVWGQRREAFCRMMLDRALQMADERGAMR